MDRTVTICAFCGDDYMDVKAHEATCIKKLLKPKRIVKPKGFKAKMFDGYIHIANRAYKDWLIVMSFDLTKDFTPHWNVVCIDDGEDEYRTGFQAYEDAVEFYNNWKPLSKKDMGGSK